MNKLLIFLFFLPWNAFSQKTEIDSLLIAIEGQSDIRQKGKMLNELAAKTLRFSLDDSKFYALTALSYGNQLHDGKIIAQAYNNMAFGAYMQGKLDSAIIYCSNGLDNAKKTDDLSLVANLSSLLGAMYLNQGETDMAIDPIFDAIKIAESNNLIEPLIRCYNTAGELYQFTTDYEKSKIYYEKALDAIKRSTKDKSREVLVLSNLSRVVKNESEKIEVLKKAIEIGEANDLSRSLGYSYSALADMYMDNQDSIYKAISLYKNAYEIIVLVKNFPKIILHRMHCMAWHIIFF